MSKNHLKQSFRIINTNLKGPKKIKFNYFKDERGFFGRLYCKELYKRLGIKVEVVNVNQSFSKISGTTRGLHYQIGKYAEDKILKCTKGSLINYIVNIDKNSKDYLKFCEIKLDESVNILSYVPKGFANGIQTLKPNTELVYFTSNFYYPKYERGLNIKDPKIGIKLKKKINVISKKDKNWSYV